jgi:uncharacterized membrane protein
MSTDAKATGTSPSRAWPVVLLVVFALLSLAVGRIASRTTPVAYAPTFLPIKVGLATAALALGCFQLMTAARIYDLLRFPPKGRLYNVLHRWSGRLAIALTLPVAYHCIFVLGFGTYSTWVYIHSLLGSSIYGAFVAKVLLVRSTRFPGWPIPIAGGIVFAILLGLWLTSALRFLTT